MGHFRVTITALGLAGALATTFAGDAQAQGLETAPPPAEPSMPGVAATTAPAGDPNVTYGVGARGRWVSVPGWFLGLFLENKVPLSSYAVGGEFFRRKRDKDDPNAFFDISIGITWQDMAPPDGNWRGKNKPPGDTDFVQFKDFGFIGFDAAFLWRQHFNEYVGMHYGAGLGLAIVTGEMLRISNAFCTEANAGNTRECRPRFCPPQGCTDAELAASRGVDHGPEDPHQFADQNVPGAIPILNFLLGLNFRIPEAKGFEMRLETGWYDAFFVGLGAGYVF